MLQKEANPILFIPGERVTPKDYSFGNPVTRDTFTDLLSTSFAFGQGLVQPQVLLYAHVMANVGFDYYATLHRFIRVQGFFVLSPDEQNRLFADYSRVDRHTALNYDMKEFGVELNKEVRKLLKVTPILSPEELAALSFDELRAWVNPRRPELKILEDRYRVEQD